VTSDPSHTQCGTSHPSPSYTQYLTSHLSPSHTQVKKKKRFKESKC
jgi:hypothetical protein